MILTLPLQDLGASKVPYFLNTSTKGCCQSEVASILQNLNYNDSQFNQQRCQQKLLHNQIFLAITSVGHQKQKGNSLKIANLRNQLLRKMADTAHKKEEDKIEYFDPKEVLEEKVKLVAELILNSKHFIAFTGAGISTACGVPDFRSGVNTVLKTGPGAWEKKAQGVKDKPNANVVDMKSAIPSFTHMSLVAMERVKLLKYLVSQNVDGLHIRSGFNPAKLAQLHGNRMLEKCKKCKSQFLRDFRTREANKVFQHQTSRKCQKCGSPLYDSIINFGQNLPEYEINRSFEQAELADVCLAMGSSLTVTPAANVAKQVGKNGKLIIVNLQKTPLDQYAYVRVNAMCDDFMKLLMAELNIKVEKFVLRRLLQFKVNKEQDLEFRGIDERGVPSSYFKQVNIAYNKQKSYKILANKEPYRVSFAKVDSITIKFDFYGWLNEPSAQITLDKPREGIMELIYSPEQKKWKQLRWLQEFKFQKVEY